MLGEFDSLTLAPNVIMPTPESESVATEDTTAAAGRGMGSRLARWFRFTPADRVGVVERLDAMPRTTTPRVLYATADDAKIRIARDIDAH